VEPAGGDLNSFGEALCSALLPRGQETARSTSVRPKPGHREVMRVVFVARRVAMYVHCPIMQQAYVELLRDARNVGLGCAGLPRFCSPPSRGCVTKPWTRSYDVAKYVSLR